MSIDKVQPQNIEAERAVLGACLLDKLSLKKSIELLKPSDFYLPNHAVIFDSMISIDKKNYPIDLITIVEVLTHLELLDDVGGYGYIMDLADAVTTTKNIESHCQIVKEKALRRDLIKACNQIMQDAYSSSDTIENIFDKSQSMILDLSTKNNSQDMIHISEFVESEIKLAIETKEQGLEKPKDAISTGLSGLDEILGGGLFGGSLFLIAARPAMGKSAKVTNLAVNIAKRGYSVGFFSLEMPGHQIVQRIISSESNIDLYQTKTRLIQDSNFKKYLSKSDDISNLPIYLSDKGELDANILKSKIRKLKVKCDKKNVDGVENKLGLIIVDYLQIMDYDEKNAVVELGKITKALKRLALELNIPILVLSQLNRDLEARQNKRPVLSDIRSSGSIEQDCDIVMFIYRDEYYHPDTKDLNIAEMIIAKHRNGPTGTVKEFFEGEYSRFTSLEK
jgi:replicative DNA helicase